MSAQCVGRVAHRLIAGGHGPAGQGQAAQGVVLPVGFHPAHERLFHAVCHGNCAATIILHSLRMQRACSSAMSDSLVIALVRLVVLFCKCDLQPCSW